MSRINLTIGPRMSFADELAKRLPRMTERIRSERIVTEAIIDGLQARRKAEYMALKDKAAHFAERLKAAPARVEAAFDALLVEVDDMERNAVEATTRAAAVVADARAGVQAVVDIVNQISNGDPT